MGTQTGLLGVICAMRFRSAVGSLFLSVPFFAFGQFPGAVPPPDDLRPGFNAITPEFAKDVLGFLAGPTTFGRGTGTAGFQTAADYVAEKFKSFGLKPVGDNGTYFQGVPFYRTLPDVDSLVVGIPGTDVRIGGMDNLRIRGFGSMINKSAPVVLLRKPETIPADGKLPDGTSLTGKIVIIDQTSADRTLRRLTLGSQPVGYVLISDQLEPIVPEVSRTQARTTGARPFIVTLSRSAAAKVLDGLRDKGSSLLAPSKAIEVVDFGKALKVTGKATTEEIKVPNVVGLLEGTDPQLKEEIVGVGGHLDHLGIQNGKVYPGADDDGSGSTSVISIARAFSMSPLKPRRSILFMTFCGEEMGLLGSGYYSDHPIFPHEKMVSELQMDMVARDSYGAQNGDPNRMDKEEENKDTIRLVGSKRISTELDSTIQEINKYIGFKFKYDAEDVYTRSDHYNFAKHGIPIAFLFDGFTPDYHQPTDTIDKIDFPKLVSAARLYFMTAMTIANRDAAPKKDVPQGK